MHYAFIILNEVHYDDTVLIIFLLFITDKIQNENDEVAKTTSKIDENKDENENDEEKG